MQCRADTPDSQKRQLHTCSSSEVSLVVNRVTRRRSCNESWLDWRMKCDANGFKCNLIVWWEVKDAALWINPINTKDASAILFMLCRLIVLYYSSQMSSKTKVTLCGSPTSAYFLESHHRDTISTTSTRYRYHIHVQNRSTGIFEHIVIPVY